MAVVASRASGGLMALRDRKPYATTVRDPNYRIEVAKDDIHIYSRDGHYVSDDPFELFPKIDAREDVGHAFYLGVETARAEIAFRLGKRYTEDEPLAFGVAATKGSADEAHLLTFKKAGTTRTQPPSKTSR